MVSGPVSEIAVSVDSRSSNPLCSRSMWPFAKKAPTHVCASSAVWSCAMSNNRKEEAFRILLRVRMCLPSALGEALACRVQTGSSSLAHTCVASVVKVRGARDRLLSAQVTGILDSWEVLLVEIVLARG